MTQSFSATDTVLIESLGLEVPLAQFMKRTGLTAEQISVVEENYECLTRWTFEKIETFDGEVA